MVLFISFFTVEEIIASMDKNEKTKVKLALTSKTGVSPSRGVKRV